MMRRRIMSLALIALVVPFPALALDGGGAEKSSGPQSLSVSASLAGCGLAGSQIMCQINAGWNSLEGAENYTVSVTSADGSVMDLGTVTGRGTSAWVPYAGSGTYTVSVTAWGTPPGEEDDGELEVLARSDSGQDKEGEVSSEPPDVLGGPDARVIEPATRGNGEVVGDVAPGETPSCDDRALETQTEPSSEAAPEAEPADDGASAEPSDPEVVDTIPGDDDCTS
jgi:hypothetical protein